MKKMSVKKYRIMSFSIISVIIALFLALTIVCSVMAETISFFLVGYKVDEEAYAAAMQEGDKLAEQIVAEGSVLVKNEDATLPLSVFDTSVNVFGWGSTQWVCGGSGSGRVVNEDGTVDKADIDLLQALSDYGIDYNTELTDMYRDYKGERPYISNGTLNTYEYKYYRLYEPNIDTDDNYTDALLSNAEQFSDTAIVVISRSAGESSDAPKTQYKNDYNTSSASEDKTRTYLEISTEEEALLTYVGQAYANTVVIINSVNTMELSFMDSIDGLDSCLVVGGTGISGASAIPKLLYGDLTPSGRLSDTYAYDLSTAASYANAGLEGTQQYTNGNGLYPADGTNNGNVGDGSAKYAGVSYVDYVEGIYIGYKWYETADAEGYWDSVSNEYGAGYEGVVQYPFGYGLSYTTFAQEITKLSHANNATVAGDDEITVTVAVTNTGLVAGQHVVQLYATTPYIDGEIEKSYVTLVAFAKTIILEPTEVQTLELTFNMQDLASYDCYDANNNGFSGYELDAGEYELKLMDDSHNLSEVIGSASAAVKTAVITYNVEAITFPTDPTTGVDVNNKFTGTDAMDGISLDGSDSNANIKYLTRSDFAGTFPDELSAARAMTQNLKDTNLYSSKDANEWIDSSDSAVTTGANTGLKLYNDDGSVSDLGLSLGADYDDPTWDIVLDQMSKTEMTNLALHGYVKTAEVPSVGKPKFTEVDGPAQVGSFNMTTMGTGFPNATVLAQTFNTQLAYSVGLAMGKEALTLNYDGLYAPGINMHRSAFGGRNYEYFSEDSYLTGSMSARITMGMKNTGVYAYVKHLALYEQESYRDGLYTWVTEQALRETYLSPFKMIIEDGGAVGLMTSYSRIGAIWTGGSSALLTGILRDEWNFHGSVITDYSDHHAFMNMDQALRAGGDIWMDGYLNNGTFKCETSSNSFMQALRTACKHILYTGVNAAYTNSIYNESDDAVSINKGTKTMGFQWWIPVLIGVDVLALAGCTLWAITAVKRKDSDVIVVEPTADVNN